jgi:Subtilase family
MFAITRTPRLLVKLKAAPKLSAIKFNKTELKVTFQPLFENIQSAVGSLAETSPSQWYIMSTNQSAAETNAWDLCHHLVLHGFGIDGVEPAEFAEPDLEQHWLIGKSVDHAFAAGRDCRTEAPQDATPPLATLPDNFWFRDKQHSQFDDARAVIGDPKDKIRIAHLDTGFDPAHKTLPKFLRHDLQRNFIDGETPEDATDRTSGIFTNLGHGCGTLSILAGNGIQGEPIGGAPFLEVIPIRVANSVVLFKNSSIARALDYVHGLYQNPADRVHVITMSMGGLASQAWAEAVNALYDLGVFIVTAAGNNYGNLPTHNIVYPARFKRVIAACGVMANGNPYADLPLTIMAGNYGPTSKMPTAMAAYTPNTPWARISCSMLVDHDGRGTSAATPQIAAAAALWIQKYKAEWEKYPEGWMRVEAVRKALFNSAVLSAHDDTKYFGQGIIRANLALSERPVAANKLEKQQSDSTSFPFLRVITGFGVTKTPDVRQRMLELEALQISQRSKEIEQLLPDPESPETLSPADNQRIIELLKEAPGVSRALRNYLDTHSTSAPQVRHRKIVPQHISQSDAARLELALNPPLPKQLTRKLRVFAYDPLLGNNPDFLHLNQTVLEIIWEDSLQPGPVGEYVEVVDVDPATECGYAPVDLNHPSILSSDGLAPSESDPRFHQQMVYAVAMKTIQHFERALGRVALWSPRFVKYEQEGKPYIDRHFVQRLRIYPHALREANSYYSPEKKSLLFGYFAASNTDPGENLPGGTIFCCLSHDVIAHETAHALLDGLHRYFGEPSNEDVFAFHEAFSDIVALFQHFTVPEALIDQIARTRGDLTQHNLLAELAFQFGRGIGLHGSLRSAIGQIDEETRKWKPKEPKGSDYQEATEAHDKGAILVAAIFDAFLDIYRRRSQDLVRMATGGTGVLPDGFISTDLVSRLAREASKTAGHILNICIRALDYCPPVDIRFGEYLRALITADRDLVPDDPWGYRPAFIQGFRRRGICPDNVRNLSSNSLCWESPELSTEMKEKLGLREILGELRLDWDLRNLRCEVDKISLDNCKKVHKWLISKNKVNDEDIEALGVYRDKDKLPDYLSKSMGELRPFEVHSVRPARRIGPDGQQRTDLIIEITQSWLPKEGGKYRGGCTLIIDLEEYSIRYVIRKRVGNQNRIQTQDNYHRSLTQNNLAANYIGELALLREPFAMIHRAF